MLAFPSLRNRFGRLADRRPHLPRNRIQTAVHELGNWFGRRWIEADVPGRAHGIRTAGATIAAKNGATAHQLKAIFGWKTLEQTELYTKAVRKQIIAGGAMNLIAFGLTEEPR